MLKLLAITPLLSRSGSEISLLNLLEAITGDFDITIFTPNKIPGLKSEISKEIKLIFPAKLNDGKEIFNRIYWKVRKPFQPITLIEKLAGRQGWDVILLNTFLSISYFDYARSKAKIVVLYVHETELFLSGVDRKKIEQIIENADLILCSSNYVKNYLMILGRKNDIEVLYPSLDFTKFSLPLGSNGIRESLGFNATDFIWGMSGATLVNKNPKMFIEAAQSLIKNNNQVKFIWIGTSGGNAYEVYLRKYLLEIGLDKKILFLEKKSEDYYQYLNIIDGFVLTSYSESFSLVSLEAACFNKPVVSFPSGGIFEAVPKKLRVVTKEFSVDELVAVMEKVMVNKNSKLHLIEIEILLRYNRNCVGSNFKIILDSYIKNSKIANKKIPKI